jgi:serine phosphatase RsbU (regulator of sigma subunit)
MPNYPDQTAQLDDDATLLLYTDGLVESRIRGIDDGLERLAKLAGEIRPSHDLNEVSDRILAGMVDHPDDDVCFVALRRARA